jgi:hypothetical protein
VGALQGLDLFLEAGNVFLAKVGSFGHEVSP